MIFEYQWMRHHGRVIFSVIIFMNIKIRKNSYVEDEDDQNYLHNFQAIILKIMKVELALFIPLMSAPTQFNLIL